MNEQVSPVEEPEYVPDPEKEKQAKAIHVTVSIIRLLGVALLIVGIVIATERMPPIPPWPGYVIILIALFQMWFIPVWLIRQFVKARVAEEELARQEQIDDPDEIENDA
ncbi:MAG: hypothetical protein ABJN65_12325 [Parasphingorhabdus sp.]